MQHHRHVVCAKIYNYNLGYMFKSFETCNRQNALLKVYVQVVSNIRKRWKASKGFFCAFLMVHAGNKAVHNMKCYNNFCCFDWLCRSTSTSTLS